MNTNETEMLTPDFISIDFTIEIKVRFDKNLSHGIPFKLFVWEPDGLEQDAVRNDDDEQKDNKVTHLNHLQTYGRTDGR